MAKQQKKELEPVRPLSVIARDIRKTWPKLSPYAKPYVDAMAELYSISDMYLLDSAREIVLRFGVNASMWRGEDAKRIKAELKRALDGAPITTGGGQP